MARFTAVVQVAAPVEQVWQRITDWPQHGNWIPLTTVRVTSDRPDGVGATFVGRSALGPVGFDDPMEVVEWSPPIGGGPGHCRVRKYGRVVLGWAAFEVRGADGAGAPNAPASTLSWTEEVQLAPVWLTRPADRLIAAAGRAGFERALRTMARELEGEVRSGG
jgi:Polyketide cyclase / dehydrase and lipid transport